MRQTVEVGTEPGLPLLAVQRLEKTYRAPFPIPFWKRADAHVLHNLSFSLQRGQIMALRGANGSGKTTLLKILAGLVLADSGSIRLATSEGREPARVGFSSGEERSLFWRLDVQHNLDFFGALHGLTPPEAQDRATLLISALDLAEQSKTAVRLLSSGQRQRVLVARALLSEPDLILLDEPTGSMDEESSHLVWQLLQDRARAGAGLIVATHDDSDEAHADVTLALSADTSLRQRPADPAPPASLQIHPSLDAGREPVSGIKEASAAQPSRQSLPVLLMPFLKLAAFWKRDFAVGVSYPASFGLQISIGLLESAALFFLARVVGSGSTYLRPYGSAYFGFAALGMLAFTLTFVPIQSMSSSLREGQLTGTLEAVLATPTKSALAILGSALWPMTVALVQLLVFLVVALTAFGLHFHQPLYPLALAGLILAIASATGLGLLAAAAVLIFKRASAVSAFMASGGQLIGGVLYPIAVLPLPLVWLSALLPVTHLANCLRFSLLAKDMGGSLHEIAALAILSALYGVMGLVAMRFAVQLGRRQGALGQY